MLQIPTKCQKCDLTVQELSRIDYSDYVNTSYYHVNLVRNLEQLRIENQGVQVATGMPTTDTVSTGATYYSVDMWRTRIQQVQQTGPTVVNLPCIKNNIYLSPVNHYVENIYLSSGAQYNFQYICSSTKNTGAQVCMLSDNVRVYNDFNNLGPLALRHYYNTGAYTEHTPGVWFQYFDRNFTDIDTVTGIKTVIVNYTLDDSGCISSINVYPFDELIQQ